MTLAILLALTTLLTQEPSSPRTLPPRVIAPSPPPASVTESERLATQQAYSAWLERKLLVTEAEQRVREIMELKTMAGEAEARFRTLISGIIAKCGGVEKVMPDYSCKVEEVKPPPPVVK